jgi:hypothetical protein
MRTTMTGALLLALTLAPAQGAGNKRPRVPAGGGGGPVDVNVTLPGALVEKKVARLTDQVTWHASLAEAKAQAQKENKPIFWLHALGDLDGVC